MAKEVVKIRVEYDVELEIDNDDAIVKEYESRNELLLDCASYNFQPVLPVIAVGGVVVKDSTVIHLL